MRNWKGLVMKGKLITNTSGGKSSMAQAIKIKQMFGDSIEQICIFANTGMENEETLEFLDRCDREYNLNIIWLEAVVHGHWKGNTYRITDFKNAYRIHQYFDPMHPFHAHVKKNGIPNSTYPQCSDRLKEHVIESYKKANGLNGVKQALGFRVDEKNRAMSKPVRDALSKAGIAHSGFGDEIRAGKGFGFGLYMHEVMCRVKKSITALVDDYNLLWIDDSTKISSDFIRCISSSKKQADAYINSNITKTDLVNVERYCKKIEKYNLVFPMIDWFPMTKEDVNDFWEEQSFNLELEAHMGNCATCWKKSDKKLHLIALERPELYQPFKWLEEKYKHVKPNTKNGKDRVFFRKHRNSDMIIGEAQLMDAYMLRKLIGANIDDESGCAESCNGYQL